VAGFGAKAYRDVAVQTAVGTADPHRMILMLYDGAIEATRLAQAHMGARRIPAKCEALGKALRIVEEGLKASVDRKVGGQLADRLVALYDYITMRLLQANLRNDRSALEEAGIPFTSAELTMLPNQTVPLTDEATARGVLRLIDALEEHDDVQAVYANFDIPDDVLQAVVA